MDRVGADIGDRFEGLNVLIAEGIRRGIFQGKHAYFLSQRNQRDADFSLGFLERGNVSGMGFCPVGHHDRMALCECVSADAGILGQFKSDRNQFLELPFMGTQEQLLALHSKHDGMVYWEILQYQITDCREQLFRLQQSSGFLGNSVDGFELLRAPLFARVKLRILNGNGSLRGKKRKQINGFAVETIDHIFLDVEHPNHFVAHQ